FEQPGNIIQSTGMNAYLDEKRVELLHKARGSYDPAKG
ncbi:LPS export ABC transporter periplasmic protein LptC, partial [Legionella pneumophila]